MVENIYKRYMVFGSYDYEGHGGINDCKESFNNKIDAIEYARKSEYDDVHVFDREVGKIIYDKDDQ